MSKDSMLEEYTGAVVEIIFNNSDNGYTVAIFETELEAFTIVGNIPAVAIGKSYKLSGNFVDHPTYGEQFKVKFFEETLPSGKEGIREFLSSNVIKGLGRKKAAAIVDRFGEKTLEIIENSPERLAEVPGIGPKTAEKIASSYMEHRDFANVAMKLQAYGITATYATKLYQTYGASTIEVVESNPYCLVDDIFGIGFRKADQIARNMGIPADDEFRIESGVKFTLQYFANEGNTFMPETELCEKAGQLLDLPKERVAEVLEGMAFSGDIHIEILEGRRVVFLIGYYAAEQNVSKCLKLLNESDPKPIPGQMESMILRTEKSTGIELSDNQKHAVITSLSACVSVITGGPGTGKTTIINTIINILEDSGLKTAIAAPTGRAAKRITETSGHAASTIHRLLEYSFAEGEDYMSFGKNSEDQLDFDAVIVDEASMIDLMLMNGLVSAIKPRTRFIIVGDDDQLPSVGAGNVLRDIIASEYIYCTRLTEIFRQAKESMIVVNAHKINHGEYPDCNAKDKDFFLLRRSGENEMMETIKELCIKRLPEYYDGVSAIRDIQVLTPVRKGKLGCLNMNVELQAILNPKSDDKPERVYGDKLFRQGDKVMQIRNNYEIKWKDHDNFTEGEGVFNGDVGFIEYIDTEFNEVTVIFDETKWVTYSGNQLDELELAYAVTVHKSQGSEFPIVIMPMTWFPPMLATRNLLYTGVTRGKRVVVLVGSENKLNGMVDNNSIKNRYSGLGIRLKRFLNGGDEIAQILGQG